MSIIRRAGEMQDGLDALGDGEPPNSVSRSFAGFAHDVGAADRAGKRHVNGWHRPGDAVATTPSTSGMTSPARRTITVSPMQIPPLRSTSSALCRVRW